MSSKYFFIVGLILITVSCNKPLPDYSDEPFDYTVTGLGDTSLPANSYMCFNPSVTLISGNPATQPITVTFRGVPANVAIQKDSFTFRPNYNLNDSFEARNAAEGKYPMQVIFSSPGTATKTYNFNLTITAPVNRVAELVGGYFPSNSCVNNIYVSCEIDSVPGNPDMIMLVDRTATSSTTYGTFDTTYGTVDCCSNTFVIPSQKVQNTTVQGYGTFNAMYSPYSIVTLNRTIVTDTATYTCIVTLSQN